MGYTHSTYRPPNLDRVCFRSFAADVRAMIEAVAPTVSVRGGDGTGPPTVTDDVVEFNGDGARGQACEPFLITQKHRPDLGQRTREGRLFAFCKTEGLPYDTVVVGAFFSLAHRCAGVEFHSDGRREQLRAGLELFVGACRPRLQASDLLATVVTAR